MNPEENPSIVNGRMSFYMYNNAISYTRIQDPPTLLIFFNFIEIPTILAFTYTAFVSTSYFCWFISGTAGKDMIEISLLHPEDAQEDHLWRDEVLTMIVGVR